MSKQHDDSKESHSGVEFVYSPKFTKVFNEKIETN